MRTFRRLAAAGIVLVAASAPIAAFTGFYAPHCANAVVWTLSGYHYQNVCN